MASTASRADWRLRSAPPARLPAAAAASRRKLLCGVDVHALDHVLLIERGRHLGYRIHATKWLTVLDLTTPETDRRASLPR